MKLKLITISLVLAAVAATGGLEYKISRFAILAEYCFSYNVLPFIENKKNATTQGIKYKTFGHLLSLGCEIYL